MTNGMLKTDLGLGLNSELTSKISIGKKSDRMVGFFCGIYLFRHIFSLSYISAVKV